MPTNRADKLLFKEEQTAQTASAIALLNRLSIADIKLKRSERLSEGMIEEIRKYRESIHSLADSLVIGENVRHNLMKIEQRVTQFEEQHYVN